MRQNQTVDPDDAPRHTSIRMDAVTRERIDALAAKLELSTAGVIRMAVRELAARRLRAPRKEGV